MTVDTSIDEEVILLHDFEYELPCESDFSCGNEAEWRMVRRCCGFTVFFCDACKERDGEWLESWGGNGPITCTECFARLEVVKQSDAYTTIERI